MQIKFGNHNRPLSYNENEDSEAIITPLPGVPGQSMGDFKLRMTRNELYEVLQRPSPQPLEEDEMTELFEDRGLRVEYDNEQVILLESDGVLPLIFEDFEPFKHSYAECVQWIKNKDAAVMEAEEEIVSKKLGISFKTNKSADQPPYLVAIFPPTNVSRSFKGKN